MPGALDYCSQALISLDARTISSFDSPTREAEVAAALYEVTKSALLSSYPWNFSMRDQELSRRLAPPADTRWTYAYAVPGGCVAIRTVYEPDGHRIAYAEEGDAILANEPRVFLKFQIDPGENEYPAFFQQALIAQLKSVFAEPVVGEGNVIDRARAEATEALRRARRTDAQNNPNVRLFGQHNSSWIRAQRGGRSSDIMKG